MPEREGKIEFMGVKCSCAVGAVVVPHPHHTGPIPGFPPSLTCAHCTIRGATEGGGRGGVAVWPDKSPTG